MSAVDILAQACVCGHAEADHPVDDLCEQCGRYTYGDGSCKTRGCGCEGFEPRCQNCGEVMRFRSGEFDVCSRRCAYQLDYAQRLVAA